MTAFRRLKAPRSDQLSAALESGLLASWMREKLVRERMI